MSTLKRKTRKAESLPAESNIENVKEQTEKSIPIMFTNHSEFESFLKDWAQLTISQQHITPVFRYYLQEGATEPLVGTQYSAGIDLYTHSVSIEADYIEIDTGVYPVIPEGWVGLLFMRSGSSSKMDYVLSNCVGVIDSDYRGSIKGRLKRLDRISRTLDEHMRAHHAKIVEANLLMSVVMKCLSVTSIITGKFFRKLDETVSAIIQNDINLSKAVSPGKCDILPGERHMQLLILPHLAVSGAVRLSKSEFDAFTTERGEGGYGSSGRK